MNYGTIGILDQNKGFAERLVRLAVERKQVPFHIHVFTDQEQLLQSDTDMSVLIIAEKLFDRLSGSFLNSLCIVLTEQRDIAAIDGCPAIFRYQSGLKIWEEVLRLSADYFGNEIQSSYGMQKAELTGVYNPLNYEDRFLFSVQLSKALMEKKSVLYLNLDSCCGFQEVMSKNFDRDITDLLYYWKQKQGNFRLKLNSLTEKIDELYIVAPACCEYDLEEISTEEWMSFLTFLEQESGYQIIVIQFGIKIRGLPDILSMCKNVYIPMSASTFSEEANACIRQTFCRMNKEDLINRMKTVKRTELLLKERQVNETGWEKAVKEVLQEENNEGVTA